MDLYPGSLLLAGLLAAHGVRKGSLATSGAIAAFAVGYLSLATPVQACGATLLTFYLVGSRATKVGHDIKARYETEDAVKKAQGTRQTGLQTQHKAQSGGKRDAVQVLCNSLLGTACAVAFRLLHRNHDQNYLYNPLDGTALFADTWRPALFFAMMGHYACCMGDTLASELGILAKGEPRLIVPPFATVPRGTNGATSVLGTVASLGGGIFIGLVASTFFVFFDSRGLAAERDSLSNMANDLPWQFIASCMALGAIGGLAGSGIDSLLGATLQRTWYNVRRKQVLVGRLPAQGTASKSVGEDAATRKDWVVVTGRDVLSNSAVNFISSLATALLIAALGTQLISQSL